jgi:hypothetical protein
LTTKPSHVGVNVDKLDCSLHSPMVYNCQMRGQGLLPGIILSCHSSGWWRLSRACLTRGPGVAPSLRGRWDGQIGGEILPARAYCTMESEGVDHSRDLFFLGW